MNKEIKLLSPFKKLCITIGNLPTAYIQSMSYYEGLTYLVNYLYNNVIPAVNNNGEAVEELQEKYVELKNYVDNYFENLNVQAEINNKLDEMAESGELEEIIKQYIDPFINAQNLEIARINGTVEAIDIKVDALESGSPLVASSVDDMTNTEKVYVNTSDGNWYYYDGDSWEVGGVYQSSGISPTDPIILAINENFDEISEYKKNMYTTTDVQVGRNWTGGTAANRAVEYVKVNPSTKYTVELVDTITFPNVGVFEKATNQGSSPILVNQYVRSSSPKLVLTTSASTQYICFQFEKSGDVASSDFTDNTLIVFKGTSPLYGANDKTARQEIENIEVPFDTFKELAASRLEHKHRFSGYEMRTDVNYKPYVRTHTQDAHTDPYYDVTATLNQYYPTSEMKLPKNICNNLPHEDIDFTPAENGFTRIIVGKNSDDLFFVSYVASDRLGQFGDGKYDRLEVTDDFVNFRTIIRGSLDNVETDGIVLSNMSNIKVSSVKEFSDGTYIVAIRCLNTNDNTNYTHFYRLSADMSSITHCRYTNFNNEVVDMVDEYGGEVYDWHIFISGNKALVTTYGNRNPSTDLGRVWYTENCGYAWKQIFQTANHLPVGVQAHTHGVMIDPYTNKLYVIVGENYASIWYSSLGYNTTDNDWTKIDLTNTPVYDFQSGSQVVNGYPFRDSLLFGSDNSGVGAIYRFNKLDDGSLSELEAAHEFLPNKYNGTFYCSAELSRKNSKYPLFMCETHENCMITEENNENLNKYHKARVIATMDGVHIVEIWTDDTYGERTVYINNVETTRSYSMCTRGMNFWLLNNGDAVLKFCGRDYQYFGGNPMFSVVGNTGDSCKVRIFKNLEKYL